MTGQGGATPFIELDFPTMWCRRHWRPFMVRNGLPHGAKATVDLFGKAAAMQAIVDAAQADAHNLGDAMRRFAPICCFVSADDLEAVYAASGIRSMGQS
jgi:hypothetical protein